MATIREIAEIAGVSRGTVDRVLNNRGAVNKETKEKVLKVAKSLNYKPNKAGIILAAQRKKLKIGVIFFGIGSLFFDEIEKGILKKARELEDYNCTVLIRRVENGVEAQLKAIRELLKEDIDGISICPYNTSEIAACLQKVSDLEIPVVTFNSDISNSARIAYVGTDYFHSGQTAAGLMHLMTNGAVKCGIISGFDDVPCHTERIAGFYDRIKKEYSNIEIVDTLYNNDTDSISFDITTKLLQKHPEINALFLVAGGVNGACRAVTSLDRQEDIFILAHDQIGTTPELIRQNIISAIICQQPQIQGELPLEILFDYLTTGELPKNEINYMPVTIKIKENL